MTKDIKKEDLGVFIQLENAEHEDVRYIAVGNISDNGLLTGIVHGYEGGGEYSELFIVNGEYVSNYNDKEEVCLDWEEQIEIFEELTEKGFADVLDKKISEYAHYDKKTLHYVLHKDVDYTFDDETMRVDFNTVPPSYCNTSWSINIETIEALNAPSSLLTTNREVA